MTPLDRIRGLLDQPGRDVNAAARDYARLGTDVVAALKAEPILYGELARGALQWVSNLLTAVERTATARPAAEPIVGPLMARVVASFDDPSRWPQVAHLEHPLRLLMPAYDASHAVHLLDYLVLPPLLEVEFDEPHDFIEEMLGTRPAITIRQHKNADCSALPKVVGDGATDEPLAFRSFLSARQRGRLSAARAAAAAAPPAAEPSPPAPTASGTGAEVQADVDAILAAGWTRRLSATRITLQSENSFDSGYGSSVYHASETWLDLRDGGTYRLRRRVELQMTGSPFPVGGDPTITDSWGTWSVTVSGSDEALRLIDESGETSRYRLGATSSDSIELDGGLRLWQRI